MYITKNFRSSTEFSRRVNIFSSEQQQVCAAVKKIKGALSGSSTAYSGHTTASTDFNMSSSVSLVFLPAIELILLP